MADSSSNNREGVANASDLWPREIGRATAFGDVPVRDVARRLSVCGVAGDVAPVEARLEQLGTGDFLFDGPGLFEVVLLPQIYNARRFALDAPVILRHAVDEAEARGGEDSDDAPMGEEEVE